MKDVKKLAAAARDFDLVLNEYNFEVDLPQTITDSDWKAIKPYVSSDILKAYSQDQASRNYHLMTPQELQVAKLQEQVRILESRVKELTPKSNYERHQEMILRTQGMSAIAAIATDPRCISNQYETADKAQQASASGLNESFRNSETKQALEQM